MNAGAYVTGSQLMRLGEYYAKQSMITMEMTLMYYLDQHTKEFQLQ